MTVPARRTGYRPHHPVPDRLGASALSRRRYLSGSHIDVGLERRQSTGHPATRRFKIGAICPLVRQARRTTRSAALAHVDGLLSPSRTASLCSGRSEGSGRANGCGQTPGTSSALREFDPNCRPGNRTVSGFRTAVIVPLTYRLAPCGPCAGRSRTMCGEHPTACSHDYLRLI